MRASARRGSALAASLACAALLLPGSAVAQSGGGSPSAGELWRQYPLQTKGSAPATGTTTTTTAPRATAVPRPTTTAPATRADASSDGTPLALLLVLVVLATALSVAALVLRTRRMRPARAAAAHDLEPTPRTQEVQMTDDPTPVPTPSPRAARPPDEAVGWITEIAWQQAPGRCRFCAVAVAADGADRAPVTCSVWLDWPPTERSPVSALADAVAELERSLAAAGWQPLEPGEAWYAKRFVWTPAARPDDPAPVADAPPEADDDDLESFMVPRRFVRGPGWPEASDGRWRCEIRWDAARRGDARFRAVALPPGDDASRPVGASAPVSSPFTGDAAVWGLEHALLEAGWERAGRGAEWYAQRFVWPRDGEPPMRVEPAVREGM